MGKGDKKSKRGKISIGSYGVRRSRRKSAFKAAAPVAEAKPAKTKPQPKKVIEQTDLEEAPVVQSNTPVENGEGEAKKTAKKAAPKKNGDETKAKASKTKKPENPEEQQQLF